MDLIHRQPRSDSTLRGEARLPRLVTSRYPDSRTFQRCGCHCHQQRCSKVRQSALWESYPPACYLCCNDRHRTEILSSPVGPSRTAIRAGSIHSMVQYEPLPLNNSHTHTIRYNGRTSDIHMYDPHHHAHDLLGLLPSPIWFIGCLPWNEQTHDSSHCSVGRTAALGFRIPYGWEPKALDSAIVRSEIGRPLDHGRYQGGHVLEAVQTPELGFPQLHPR